MVSKRPRDPNVRHNCYGGDAKRARGFGHRLPHVCGRSFDRVTDRPSQFVGPKACGNNHIGSVDCDVHLWRSDRARTSLYADRRRGSDDAAPLPETGSDALRGG